MLFSKLGIQEEILTDQGTNFTSQLVTGVVSYATCAPYPYEPVPPTDRWPRGAIQSDPEDDVTEDSGRQGQRLGLATTVRPLRLQRSAPELDRILAL